MADEFAGIEAQPEVCGGAACVARTRIPVWVLEQARRLGTSEQELLGAYPGLRAEDVGNAWAEARTQEGEMEAEIGGNEGA